MNKVYSIIIINIGNGGQKIWRYNKINNANKVLIYIYNILKFYLSHQFVYMLMFIMHSRDTYC